MTDSPDLDFLSDLLRSGGDSKIANDGHKFTNGNTQTGPLRYYDIGMRCLSKRCGSPTHYKFRGVPYCSVHALRKMNEELTQYENDAVA